MKNSININAEHWLDLGILTKIILTSVVCFMLGDFRHSMIKLFGIHGRI